MNSNGSVNKELHMFPFGIECENGKEIDIETYFKPTIRKDNKTDTITGSFRGRSLNGLEVHLPPGYVGFTQYCGDNLDDYQSDKYRFNSFTYWKLDDAISNNDPFQLLLKLITAFQSSFEDNFVLEKTNGVHFKNNSIMD
ncbi:hypothetical protein GJ496_007781 [Pomphorhynchus laevis]|nr:hypothetical protein GJ496_007781 [Pomphorhynchus laevis]